MDWISVKDKLPDIGEVVLVANDYTVSTAYMNENKVFESEDYSFIYVNKVKYWMPYPKAPKEEKKDDKI